MTEGGLLGHPPALVEDQPAPEGADAGEVALLDVQVGDDFKEFAAAECCDRVLLAQAAPGDWVAGHSAA